MSKCEVCGGGELRHEEVEEVFHVDERYVLVERIPATVCVQCGERTFDAATAEDIRQMLHDRHRPTRSVALEVLAF